MKLFRALFLTCACSVVGVATNAVSQGPSVGKVHDIHGPHTNPTNLKVLPKTMSGDEVDKLMREYQQGLGATCEYCHAENAQTKKLDFASDENPMKDTARFMIAMTNDINNKYLAQLGDRRYALPFSCGNCHQGNMQPPPFEPKQN